MYLIDELSGVGMGPYLVEQVPLRAKPARLVPESVFLSGPGPGEDRGSLFYSLSNEKSTSLRESFTRIFCLNGR